MEKDLKEFTEQAGTELRKSPNQTDLEKKNIEDMFTMLDNLKEEICNSKSLPKTNWWRVIIKTFLEGIIANSLFWNLLIVNAIKYFGKIPGFLDITGKLKKLINFEKIVRECSNITELPQDCVMGLECLGCNITESTTIPGLLNTINQATESLTAMLVEFLKKALVTILSTVKEGCEVLLQYIYNLLINIGSRISPEAQQFTTLIAAGLNRAYPHLCKPV